MKKIKDEEYVPDAVIGISRGGLPICVRISHLLEVPMGVVQANHYKGDGYHTMEDKAVIKGELLGEEIKGKILLIDDITDTGKTLKVVDEKLSEYNKIDEIKTAVLHQKPHSCFEPDFCAYPSQVNKWVVYPFEKLSPRN